MDCQNLQTKERKKPWREGRNNKTKQNNRKNEWKQEYKGTGRKEKQVSPSYPDFLATKYEAMFSLLPTE